VGKLLTSHRYNRIPLLLSRPGGVLQELVVWDLPGAKVQTLFTHTMKILKWFALFVWTKP